MNEMQSRILKAAADFGQVSESQLGSDSARAEMAALVDEGYVVKVSDSLIAELEAATARTSLEGDSQGDSMRREARNQRGTYVLTPRGEAWANANGSDAYTHSFIEYLFVVVRKAARQDAGSSIAEAEEIIEAAHDDAAFITAEAAARQFSVPAGLLLAACKSSQVERAEIRDGVWHAPSGSFWAFAQQYHYDGR